MIYSPEDRERVARIIDPEAWAELDALVAERTVSRHALFVAEISAIVGSALSKADQILARRVG